MAVPPSSPRLPSPPPVPEIQFGPKSPGMVEGGQEQENMIEKSILEANSARRIHPGTNAADMATGPPLISLSQLDSPFQLQEHLKALHYSQTRPSASHEVPINRESAKLIANPPPGVDKNLWLYELCRFIISKCNDLIVGFLFDTPPCSALSCPEMRASEWQFLCAVHEAPKSCCAIDYCCHTLDWAANMVTSQKNFPSRLSLGSEDGNGDNGGVKHLGNIFRRLHRIFAHAWFQHREVFWRIEGESGLYVLFKIIGDTYNLLNDQNFKLPPEAEGLESQPEPRQAPRQIMKAQGRSDSQEGVEDDSYKNIGRNNTRRHIRSSPSTGSSVMTVPEADEEDVRSMSERLTNMIIKEEKEVPSFSKPPPPTFNESARYAAFELPRRESQVTEIEVTEEEEVTENVEGDTQKEDADEKVEEIVADASNVPLESGGSTSSPPSSPIGEETKEKSENKAKEDTQDEDGSKTEQIEDTEVENTADTTKGEEEKQKPVHKLDLHEESPSSPSKDKKEEKEGTDFKKEEAK